MSPLNYYRIYPSLLDGFQRMLDADLDADAFWNLDDEGMPKRSADDLYAEREQALLDSINRVEREPIEAADKGTAFNALVDYVNGTPLPDGLTLATRLDEQYGEVWDVSLNGFTFTYAHDLVAQASASFAGAVAQHRCEAWLETGRGLVQLYGYADEILPDKVVDIKTTGRYEFGAFSRKWQKDVYPYCLVRGAEMPDVCLFEYAVFVWDYQRKGAPLTAKRYDEQYMYDHAKATERLRGICEQFIDWLEVHRELITDTKIFAEAR